MIIEIPLRVAPLCNKRLHWGQRSRIANYERGVSRAFTRSLGDIGKPPWIVKLTRVGRRRPGLDDDNLRNAMKHIRDGVADALGYDDSARSPITWEYAQEFADNYFVIIEIEGTLRQ